MAQPTTQAGASAPIDPAEQTTPAMKTVKVWFEAPKPFIDLLLKVAKIREQPVHEVILQSLAGTLGCDLEADLGWMLDIAADNGRRSPYSGGYQDAMLRLAGFDS